MSQSASDSSKQTKFYLLVKLKNNTAIPVSVYVMRQKGEQGRHPTRPNTFYYSPHCHSRTLPGCSGWQTKSEAVARIKAAYNQTTHGLVEEVVEVNSRSWLRAEQLSQTNNYSFVSMTASAPADKVYSVSTKADATEIDNDSDIESDSDSDAADESVKFTVPLLSSSDITEDRAASNPPRTLQQTSKKRPAEEDSKQIKYPAAGSSFSVVVKLRDGRDVVVSVYIHHKIGLHGQHPTQPHLWYYYAWDRHGMVFPGKRDNEAGYIFGGWRTVKDVLDQLWPAFNTRTDGMVMDVIMGSHISIRNPPRSYKHVDTTPKSTLAPPMVLQQASLPEHDSKDQAKHYASAPHTFHSYYPHSNLKTASVPPLSNPAPQTSPAAATFSPFSSLLAASSMEIAKSESKLPSIYSLLRTPIDSPAISQRIPQLPPIHILPVPAANSHLFSGCMSKRESAIKNNNTSFSFPTDIST